jgi:hypothetical protein
MHGHICDCWHGPNDRENYSCNCGFLYDLHELTYTLCWGIPNKLVPDWTDQSTISAIPYKEYQRREALTKEEKKNEKQKTEDLLEELFGPSRKSTKEELEQDAEEEREDWWLIGEVFGKEITDKFKKAYEKYKLEESL